RPMAFTDSSTTEIALRRSIAWIRRKLEDTGVNWTSPSLLFSSLRFLWISARYKWRRHGFYHLRLEVDFTVHQIHREAAVMAPIGCGIYKGARGCTSLDLFLLLFMYGYAAQEVCR
ncbi:hypothetical protein K440DRAFT_629258, partial [Wilcoxina mikolae CBS 423.85]